MCDTENKTKITEFGKTTDSQHFTENMIFFFNDGNFEWKNTVKSIKTSKNKTNQKRARALKIWIKPGSPAMFLQFIIALSYVLYMSLKITEFEV